MNKKMFVERLCGKKCQEDFLGCLRIYLSKVIYGCFTANFRIIFVKLSYYLTVLIVFTCKFDMCFPRYFLLT